MAHSDKFVACIIHNNKVMREVKEDKNTVIKLPFKSEYLIRLKNLNSERAAVSVFIDDEDVLDGKQIVINPNDSHDLLGFMNGNVVKNRFKFIEKTKQISEYRGDRVGDGLIRVEFQFEKPKPTSIEPSPYIKPLSPKYPPYIYPPYDRDYPPYVYPPYKWYPEPIVCFDSDSTVYRPSGVLRSMNVSNSNESNATAYNVAETENGITVKGSTTHKKYQTVHLRQMEEQKHVIVLSLKGKMSTNQGEALIEKPLTVKKKIQCQTCGVRSKSSAKFCKNCGTCLI